MNKKAILIELNKIFFEETRPLWKYECCFCGKKSEHGRWMARHIIGHLRQCMPVCNECRQQHIPDEFYDREEILDNHTETVGC
jgi:hypothetical protein